MDGLGWAGGRKTSQRKIIHHRGMDAKRRALSLYLCFGLHDMPGFLSLYLFPLSTMSSVFFFAWQQQQHGEGREGFHRKAGLAFCYLSLLFDTDEETRDGCPP